MTLLCILALGSAKDTGGNNYGGITHCLPFSAEQNHQDFVFTRYLNTPSKENNDFP